MRWHELKTDPAVFDAVANGSKTHEIRKNDRDFKVGDGLLLRRTKWTGKLMKGAGYPLEYTGEEHRCVVTHVLEGYGLEPGWVILSIKPHGVAPCEPPGCEGCNCAACELRRKHEAVSSGVDLPDGSQR